MFARAAASQQCPKTVPQSSNLCHVHETLSECIFEWIEWIEWKRYLEESRLRNAMLPVTCEQSTSTLAHHEPS